MFQPAWFARTHSRAAMNSAVLIVSPTQPDLRQRLLHAWGLGLGLYLLVMVWLLGQGGDFAIADRIYAAEGGAWALRSHWFTEGGIHAGGRMFSYLLWLGMAGFGTWAWHRNGWRSWRRPLMLLLASVLASTVLVSVLKRSIAMECPWHLLRYGGDMPYIGLFELRPGMLPANACFPAGHASAGYAWIALYFFLLQVAPRWRWWGLGLGVGLGLVFGIGQQLRGAHFLSHDVSTLMLCWSMALGLYLLGNRGTRL